MEDHQPQATTESEDSAESEDVEVCDICGDAGQEGLLVFCSKCRDGAEHIYCMWKKLRRPPKGDWLCQECKIKEETKNQYGDKSETDKGQSEILSLNESTCNPKNLQESDTSIQDCEARGSSEEGDLNNSKKVSESTGNLNESSYSSKLIQESDSSIQNSEARGTNEEVDLNTGKKVSESTSISVGAAISKAKSVLSRGSSFSLLEAAKLKQAKPAASRGGQSVSNGQPFTRLQNYSGLNSSKVLGPLSKSVSFNNSNVKPKVKQLIGSVPQKQITSREFTSRMGLVKKNIGSASLRSGGPGCFNTESINKVQGLPPPWVEEHRVLKQEEERNIIEKESSIERPNVNPAPIAGVSSHPNPEALLKSESNVLHINRRSLDTDNSGCELKKASCVSKTFVRSSSSIRGQKLNPTGDNVNVSTSAADRSCNIPEAVLQRTAPRIIEFTHRDDKLKDSTFPNVPKQGASGGSRILHCKKCNEAGHSTQLCSIDKLHASALEPSADQKSREVHNQSSKWKDAMHAALSKFEMLKNSRLADHSEKSSISNTELSSRLPSKNFQSDSSSREDILRTTVADPSKTVAVVDVNLQAAQQFEASCAPKGSDTKHIPVSSDSNQMKLEPSPQIFPNEASVLPNILRASVIPEHEFIWQGGFEVLRSGRVSKFCDGVQAHLSTFASPKVLEAAIKFPGKVQLEEVTCITSWPWQFQGFSPQENNIGLFFFAKDFESYEKNYWKLLEDMIKNDLALKGNIEGVELLVFPSNKLPLNCQRWNRLFFLWGIFRGKSSSCHETLTQFQEKPCKSSLMPLFQDLPTPGAQIFTCQKLHSHENPDDAIPISDGSPKAKRVKSASCVDLQPTLSSGAQMNATQLSNGAMSKKNSGSEGTKDVHSQSYEKMDGKDLLMIDEGFWCNNPGQNATESSLNRKRALPTSIEAFSRALDETANSTSGLMQLNEKVTFPPVDDRREHKKMKLEDRVQVGHSKEENFVSLPANFLADSIDSETMIPDSSTSSERHFFPMDLNPVKDMKSDTIVHGLTLEKDGPSKIPNLELELGGKKELPKEEVLLLSPTKVRDEIEASLSLSLAFHASKE